MVYTGAQLWHNGIVLCGRGGSLGLSPVVGALLHYLTPRLEKGSLLETGLHSPGSEEALVGVARVSLYFQHVALVDLLLAVVVTLLSVWGSLGFNTGVYMCLHSSEDINFYPPVDMSL